ncbi:MAG: D-alanine--D-alanine ligase family protein [Acidobacteriota bacterium]
MTKRALRVGVVFGGRSVEHKVSVVSARTVASALTDGGHSVVPLGVAEDGCWLDPSVAGRALDPATGVDALAATGGSVRASLEHLVRAEVDAIFPIVHGTWGEDGTLQGLCEMLDLPYVGADVTASAVCMDKVLCKQVLAAAGLPVVDGEVFDDALSLEDLDRCGRLGLPVFVKPSVGGSSVGVTKVTCWDDLGAAVEQALRFADRALVERAVVGRELECAVLGVPAADGGGLEASGIGEIVPGADFYDYADKYIDDGAQLVHAAELTAEQEEQLRRRAVDAFAAVGGEGMARVDFLMGHAEDGESEAFINEINTLPGFTSISMYPKLWQVAGLDTAGLVDRLVGLAMERHRTRRSLDQGIKSWIASLAG